MTEQHQVTHAMRGSDYRPDIDGLRAAAVTAVVIYHAFSRLMPGGFVGVDVFFVISGFLISGIIYADLERNTFSLADFYARRIRRIFPALLITLVTVLVVGWFVLFDDEFRRLAAHTLASSGFFVNFTYYREADYFDVAASNKPLLHLWSLAVEEQFYLLWPLLLLLSRRTSIGIKGLLALTGLMSFAINIYLSHSPSSADFYLPFSRFWELMLGGTVAYISRRRSWTAPAPHLVSTIGACLIAYAFIMTEPDGFPGWWALVPTLGTVLIISAGPAGLLNRYLFANPLVVRIGVISYPLYLWHWPLLSFEKLLDAGSSWWPLRLSVVLLAVLLAWLTWRFVETPIRSVRARRAAMPLVASLLVIAGAASILMVGGTSRLGAMAGILEVGPRGDFDPTGSTDWCESVLNHAELEEEGCITNSAQPTVMFVGDSHALALYSAILAGRVDLPGVVIWGGACPLYPDLTYVPTHKRPWGNNCTAIARDIVPAVSRIPSISTVVIVQLAHAPIKAPDRLDEVLGEGFFDHGILIPSLEEEIVKGTGGLVASLQSRGIRVLYLMDNPRFDYGPNDCVARLPLVTAMDCRKKRVEFDFERREYDAAVLALSQQYSSLRVINPIDMFCDEQYCRLGDARGFYYRDQHHLGTYGSEMVLRQFVLGAIN